MAIWPFTTALGTFLGILYLKGDKAKAVAIGGLAGMGLGVAIDIIYTSISLPLGKSYETVPTGKILISR